MATLGRSPGAAPLTSADIPDGSVTAAKIATDTIAAGDVAADAIGASELANDAVAAANIIDGSVGTTEMAASVIGVKPHIIPNVLYPAVAGKLLDGSTSHGATYGVAQADGRSYYYTDIKGSKPIKDPRIGAHFGSQRHNLSSIQLLEQETATHGSNVYSVDGREWFKLVGANWVLANDAHGVWASVASVTTDTNYVEFTGYFNNVNWTTLTNGLDDINISIDGVQNASSFTGATTTVTSPLINRYVNATSLVNLVFDVAPTLGIHTIKMSNVSGDYHRIYGIELIAQDTDAADVNKIQIPSQNVVSYGKKFTVSGTPHYDPFNGFTNSTSLHSAFVDTATSLGLSTGTLHGATWAISGSNNIRPYNGGRVVKWVDSSGVIKTSVNMMPPNAQNIGTTAAAEITTPSATNVYLPAFSDDAVDHSLAEVAKTFHWREFGNGAANGGTGGTYADYSMHNTTDDLAYVMDDGLTSMSGAGNGRDSDLAVGGDGGFIYITFIGTGFGWTASGPNLAGTDNYTAYVDSVAVKTWTSGFVQSSGPHAVVQNLPYGTHIVKFLRNTANSVNLRFAEFTIHQPKMPPIPEDAVVIADYMLMADHVVRTADGVEKISKGVRTVYATRDVFYDAAGAFTGPSLDPAQSGGYYIHRDTESTVLSRITAFSTNAIKLTYNAAARYQAWYTNDTAHSSADTTTKNGAAYGSYYHPTAATTLGQNVYDQYGAGVSALQTAGYEIASPIHTSSHYQTFETPFLHELVGGDRNMEQTNLVVTPDGKTWDEVTRDVSYIGPRGGFNVSSELLTNATASSTNVLWSLFRGGLDGVSNIDEKYSAYFNKDFAIAYDRLICLRNGDYVINFGSHSSTAHVYLKINGNKVQSLHASDGSIYGSQRFTLKRGDYVQRFGGYIDNNDDEWSIFSCYKIGEN